MTDTLDILFAVTGQTVYFDVPEGRPSSVTSVQVFEDTDNDTATAESAVGSGSVESVTTTFDAASGVAESDPTKCNLTATTSLVAGRRYLATNAAGQKEWVEIERIVSADAVYGRTPLVHAYVSTDTFVSCRISATVDSTWVADSNNLSDPRNPRPRYRVVWTYVVSSVTYRVATYFNLTRYPFRLTVNAQDVARMAPGWLERLHPDEVRGAGDALLREAARLVRLDLWERELTRNGQRNNDVINDLIGLRAVWKVAEDALMAGGEAPPATLAEKRYWDRFNALIGEPKVNVQVSPDGAGGVPDRSPIWRR